MDPECLFFKLWIFESGIHISVTDWWIRNAFFNDAYFELRIGGSEILPEVPIQNFSGFHNP